MKLSLFALLIFWCGVPAWATNHGPCELQLVESERLILRPIAPEEQAMRDMRRLLLNHDVQATLLSLAKDPAYPEPWLSDYTKGTLTDQEGHRISLGIFLKETGRVVGGIRVHDQKGRADILERGISFAYIMLPEYRKKGFVREAIAVLMASIEAQTPGRHYDLLIMDSNVDSIAIAKYFGYTQVRDGFEIEGAAHHIYVRGTEEWMTSIRSYLAP